MTRTLGLLLLQAACGEYRGRRGGALQLGPLCISRCVCSFWMRHARCAAQHRQGGERRGRSPPQLAVAGNGASQLRLGFHASLTLISLPPLSSDLPAGETRQPLPSHLRGDPGGTSLGADRRPLHLVTDHSRGENDGAIRGTLPVTNQGTIRVCLAGRGTSTAWC